MHATLHVLLATVVYVSRKHPHINSRFESIRNWPQLNGRGVYHCCKYSRTHAHSQTKLVL